MIERMFDISSSAEALESIADIVAGLQADERGVAALRASQIVRLRSLSRRGYRLGVSELAGRLDVSFGTAKALADTALRTPEKSDAMAKVSSGDWSFDRAVAVAGLVGAGADDVTLAEAQDRDIAGIHKLGALWRRVTRRDEQAAHQQRSVRCWASLDESTGFIHAELAGYDWRVVTKALEERADMLPGAEATAEQRRADALVALAHDWLSPEPRSHGGGTGPIVTVTVDAKLAGATDAEAGVTITGGPRVGVETLERIMCEGSVEVLIDAGSGVPLAVGPTARVVPPKMRRFVLARDGGCVVDGCDSSYRLEVHHIIPRSRGGTHDPENLAAVCWWHHHVAIHGQGKQIDLASPPKRRRLLPPGPRPPPRYPPPRRMLGVDSPPIRAPITAPT